MIPKASKKSEITREKILESAHSLFWSRGYHRTSIDNILEQSGTSKGNFYFHFKSKEELGYAYLDRCLDFFNDLYLPQLNNPDVVDPLQRVFNFLDTVFNYQKEHKGMGGCPFGNFAVEMSDVHNGFRKKVEYVFNSWESEIERILDQAKDIGTFSDFEKSGNIPLFILSVIQGSIIIMRARKNADVLDNCRDTLKEILSKQVPKPQLQ